jgi:hypothetical protein
MPERDEADDLLITWLAGVLAGAMGGAKDGDQGR